MIFELELINIQQIKHLSFSFNLSENKIYCITGKNSIGKTTLIRSIKNITSADTFKKTASPYIFDKSSQIKYTFDGSAYTFKYIPQINTIDSKEIIPAKIKSDISVELPIPHGIRFNHFQKLFTIDEELRTKISLKQYSVADELISFLHAVYGTDRFKNLKEITIKKEKYYFISRENDFYIREDYLSSGEYFVINLFRLIQQKKKLIVIDEIDISLDASAQTKLVAQLRKYCKIYEANIIFTTHSLPLMKTLTTDELYLMEEGAKETVIKNSSYNFIKSILYGFKGWDKYILTEDKMLENYLTHLISQNNSGTFYKFKIIFIAGGSNVVNLMTRNSDENFFSEPENVISILDGDQKEYRYCRNNTKVFFIPFESIEKQLAIHYRNNELPVTVTVTGSPEKFHKNLYDAIIRSKEMNDSQIFEFLNDQRPEEVKEFKKNLFDYLNMHQT